MLGTFERVTKRDGWPHRDWASIITRLLTGEVQQAYHALPLVDAEDYGILKEEILACSELSSTRSASKFHHWSYQPGQEPRTQMDSLLCIARRWFQPDQLTPKKIVERITLQ